MSAKAMVKIKYIFLVVFLVLISMIVYSYCSNTKSDDEILALFADKIKINNFHADINNKKYAIKDDIAAMAFKMDILKETILKKELQKNSSLYEEAIKAISRERPSYLLVKQFDFKVKLLLKNTLACDVSYGKQKKMSGEEFGKLPCLGVFDNPGGLTKDGVVEATFEKFDAGHIVEPEFQAKWDTIVKQEMKARAVSKFIADYKANRNVF